MDAQAAYVIKRIQNYFATIVALSKKAEPPAVNASNGWFREYMVSDAAIAQCAQPPTLPLTGEAQTLYGVYTYFYANIERAFRDNANHPARGIIENLLAILPALGSVIGDIIGLSNGSNSDKDQAKKHLAQDISDLVQAVQQKKSIASGANANGWISVYARDAANGTRGLLDQHFPVGKPNDTGRAADILRRACLAIGGLDTSGHDPWLRAQWQISFEVICNSAAVSLSMLR